MINKLLKYNYLLLLSGIFCLMKILYTIFFQKEISGYEDWSIAKNLIYHHIYSEILSVGSSTMKLPTYPMFLGVFIYFFGASAKTIIIISQHIIYFFIPTSIYKILKDNDCQKSGIVAGYLFLFSPAYFYYSFVMEATNIFIPISILWFGVFQKIYLKKWNSSLHFIFLGAVTAILFLTQVVVVPIIIVFIIVLLIKLKINPKKTIILCLSTLLFYSPWVIRNYNTFHQFIPSKSPFYHNIFVSYTATNNIIDELKIFDEKETSKIIHSRTNISELEMEKVFQNKLQGKITTRKSILKAIQNGFLLWYVPAKYFYDNSVSIWIFRKFYVLIINLFTIFAFVYYYKNNKNVFYFFTFIFLGFTIPYMIGHASNIRFKLDFEWVQLILLALYGTNFLKNKNLEIHKTQ